MRTSAIGAAAVRAFRCGSGTRGPQMPAAARKMMATATATQTTLLWVDWIDVLLTSERYVLGEPLAGILMYRGRGSSEPLEFDSLGNYCEFYKLLRERVHTTDEIYGWGSATRSKEGAGDTRDAGRRTGADQEASRRDRWNTVSSEASACHANGLEPPVIYHHGGATGAREARLRLSPSRRGR